MVDPDIFWFFPQMRQLTGVAVQCSGTSVGVYAHQSWGCWAGSSRPIALLYAVAKADSAGAASSMQVEQGSAHAATATKSLDAQPSLLESTSVLPADSAQLRRDSAAGAEQAVPTASGAELSIDKEADPFEPYGSSSPSAEDAAADGNNAEGSDDDEFEYAFDSSQRRTASYTRRTYTPEPLPPHLVTNVSLSLNHPENTIQEAEHENSSMATSSDRHSKQGGSGTGGHTASSTTVRRTAENAQASVTGDVATGAQQNDDEVVADDSDRHELHLQPSLVQPVDAESDADVDTSPKAAAPEATTAHNAPTLDPEQAQQRSSSPKRAAGGLPSVLEAAFSKAAQPHAGANDTLRQAVPTRSGEHASRQPVHTAAQQPLQGTQSASKTHVQTASAAPLESVLSAPMQQKFASANLAHDHVAATDQPMQSRRQQDNNDESDILAPSFSKAEMEGYVTQMEFDSPSDAAGSRATQRMPQQQVTSSRARQYQAATDSSTGKDANSYGSPKVATRPAQHASSSSVRTIGDDESHTNLSLPAPKPVKTQPARPPQSAADSKQALNTPQRGHRSAQSPYAAIAAARSPVATQPKPGHFAPHTTAERGNVRSIAPSATSKPPVDTPASPCTPLTPHQPASGADGMATTTEVRALVRALSMEPLQRNEHGRAASGHVSSGGVTPVATASTGAQSPRKSSSMLQTLLARLPSRGSKLSAALATERDRMIALAKTKFDNDSELHARSLDMLYQRCMRAPCPGRFGAHWEQLGFQGNDPATDLRGSGMLAIAQMLQLFAYNSDNAMVVWQLSQVPDKVRQICNAVTV